MKPKKIKAIKNLLSIFKKSKLIIFLLKRKLKNSIIKKNWYDIIKELIISFKHIKSFKYIDEIANEFIILNKISNI